MNDISLCNAGQLHSSFIAVTKWCTENSCTITPRRRVDFFVTYDFLEEIQFLSQMYL